MVSIRVFEPGNCPQSLYRFRYSVYVEEMGRKQHYANHADRTIIDPLDMSATNVIAFEGEEIVGCVRVNFLVDGPVGDYEEFFELHRLSPAERLHASVTTRLMIERKRRRTSLSIDVVKAVYEHAIRRGDEISFIDCNRHLIGFFTKLGYRKLFEKPHVEYGNVTVMQIDVRNVAHLVSVGSPFAPICERVLLEKFKAAAGQASAPATASALDFARRATPFFVDTQ